MKISIRIATKKDIEKIVPLLISLDELHVKLYPDIFDENKIKEIFRKTFLTDVIEKPNNLFFLAEENNNIVGIIHFYIQEIKNHQIKMDKKTAVLSDLFVDKNYRNNRIASLLIESGLNIIKEKWDISDILLNVFDENKDAIYLYEKFGFRKQFSRYTIKI